jgi:hypothetical protein
MAAVLRLVHRRVVIALAARLLYSSADSWWLVFGVVAGYMIVLTSLFGCTFGKALVGIRVVDVRTGTNPSLAASGLRWLAVT